MSTTDPQEPTDERFAELLRRVLEEGLDPSSAEARGLFEEDMHDEQDIEERLAGSQAVIGLLERSARQERSDLGAAAGTTEAHHAQLVRSFVAARRAPSRSRSRWILAAAGLAAAAALLVWLGPERTSRRPAGPEIHLGGEFDLHATPEGLAWTYTLSPGGWFDVVARDAADASSAELARATRLEQPFWPISAAQRAGWPATVELEITARDGTGGIESVQRAALPSAR